jgi:tripartite-type tricarboxylate transporter receptor subunit TctC
VKHATPDGGTLLIAPIAPMVLYQHVYKNLEYDPIRDFAAVSQIATFDLAVAVGPQVPAASLQELVAWVKADPARAAFGSPGAPTLPHFFGVLVGRVAGVELRHVPYKGSAATLTDLAAGHLPMVFTTISDLVEMHKARRIRILATSGAERSPFVPNVPTFREAGFDIQGTAWYGAFAPVRTPRETVDRYSTIMAAAVRMSDVRDRFLGWGLQPTGTSAAEFAAIQKADSERWAPAVKASGFSAD